MAVYLSPVGGAGAQFFDNNGDPLTGGKLLTYLAGSTTPQATYTTSSGNVPHTNPIILNAAGRVPSGGEIWLSENVSYKFVLTDSNNVLLATWDNLPGINDGSNDSSLVVYDPPFANSVATTVENKLAESVSVKDFGAVGDGVTVDTQAFILAAAASKTIFVPLGTYCIDTPFSLSPTAAYYGPGVLKFDNAAWWRAGGSAGSTALTERYTLFFQYASQADVYCNFNGVPQVLTWITDSTFEVPAPAVGVNVIYGVYNGTLPLGDTPEQIFSYNTFANGGWTVAPALPNPLTSPVGFNNVSIGSRALKAVTTGVNNTAVGSRALTSVKTGYNNTAVGFQALYRIQSGYDNTAVGSIAGEWLITGYQNSLFGISAGAKLTDGRYNVAAGYEALGEASSTIYTVAVGYRANANTGSTSQSNSTYVGAFAGDFCKGSNTVAIGYRALNCGNNVDATPQDFTVVGAFAGRYVDNGTDCVIVGAGAAANYNEINFSTVVGMEAADTASSGTINHLTTLGWHAAREVTGDGNTAVGSGALVTETSGTNNTAVGFNAGRLSIAGVATNFSNTTTLGNDARVSGSDQVQLGNSATTTYAWGAVQNRSDARDKADVRDTVLGLSFICDLRPVDYRWDIRDDYVQVDENGLVTLLPKDGSKKRNRYHHGLLAQELKAVMDKHSVDFGGFQDLRINGGGDALTVGYSELIAPMIKAIQELTARVKELEAKC
jgi:hypothetical protein